MAEVSLKVLQRKETGKQAAKHLRMQGMVPGIIYGTGMEPISLTINEKELLTLLHSVGRNAVVNLSVEGHSDKLKSFIYDIQHEPISGDITHVDLKQISMTEKIHVTIPVRLSGVPFGVKNEGGIVEHLMHSIEVKCLPTDIPEDFRLDVEEMHLGDVIHVKDIEVEKFEIIADDDNVVVHVVAPKVKIEEEEEGEEGEGEEGVEGEEGEEGSGEPEVIGEKE